MLKGGVICDEYLQNVQYKWREERAADISVTVCFLDLIVGMARKTISFFIMGTHQRFQMFHRL